MFQILPSRKFLAVKNKCSFWNQELENLTHLLFYCVNTEIFWTQLETCILGKVKIKVKLDCRDVITYFDHNNDGIVFFPKFFV